MASEPALDIGRRVLRLEATELNRAADRLGGSFDRAVELLAATRGRVIVSGVGKSGLVARKIAATLTSTGTSATYLHPVDSLHGDLGIVGRDDAAIVLSKSGESDELTGLLTAFERLGVPVIAITGGDDSMLARLARVTLDGSVTEEACPHDLAPTTSTTVALALGDALAVALMAVKGFKRDDFAALHPGGALGRKLLLRVKDVMIDAATLPSNATMRQVTLALAHQRGLAILADGGRLAGVLSAGDLSRLATSGEDLMQGTASAHMTTRPRTAAPEDLAASALGKMEKFGIMALPVIDGDSNVVGVVHLHDLMRAGAV